MDVRVFANAGCFDATYECSELSAIKPATNVESLGYSVASQQDSGESVWLYAVSFVGTVSGSYRVDLAHTILLNDLKTKRVVGGISTPSYFTVQVVNDLISTFMPSSWRRLSH